jgi:hypothetical protein
LNFPTDTQLLIALSIAKRREARFDILKCWIVSIFVTGTTCHFGSSELFLGSRYAVVLLDSLPPPEKPVTQEIQHYLVKSKLALANLTI